MPKTLIDIEPHLLAQAQRILGVRTKKEAVNLALREVVRQEAAARFLEEAAAGLFAAGPSEADHITEQDML
jgi:Arc/MetJ family transcription regulator